MAYINVGFTYIIDYICEGILTGRFPEGERIPSVRDMAVLMQVAPNTVVHAYDKLSQRELIHTQRGVGYYITPGAFESVLAQRRKVFHEETIHSSSVMHACWGSLPTSSESYSSSR